MSGCGCGGAKGSSKGTKREPQQGQEQAFRLTLPDGSTSVYGSRLEADAARVRSGRVGTITRF